jgi:hypothetical protein
MRDCLQNFVYVEIVLNLCAIPIILYLLPTLEVFSNSSNVIISLCYTISTLVSGLCHTLCMTGISVYTIMKITQLPFMYEKNRF